MNSWNFTGNVGKANDLKYTDSNDAVLSFSVAVRSGFGKSENTVWVNCSLWGKRAESLAPYIVKGASVAVSGEVNNRAWANKDGVQQMSLEARVNDLTLIGGKQDSDARQLAKAQPGTNVQSADFDDSDSIPF